MLLPYAPWSFGAFCAQFGIALHQPKFSVVDEPPPHDEDGDEGDEEQKVAGGDEEAEERDEEEESEEGQEVIPFGFREVKTLESRLFLFDSVTQMVEAIDAKHYGTRHRDFGRNDLTTFEAFKKALDKPWQEGIDTLDRCVRQLEDAQLPELKQHTRRVRFGEEGDDFDYDRFRGGQSEFWRSSVREDSEGPTEVTIFIDLTTVWHVKAEDVLWRGAAAIALAEIIEAKGYRTEIWVLSGSQSSEMRRKNGNLRLIDAINLKQTRDPLDRSTLINAVSAWFYRLGMFALRDTIETTIMDEKRSANHLIATPTPSDLDQISRDQNRVYSSGVFSFNGALEMMRAEIKKLAH